jgi:mono/diheme cytochrome c family protein
MDCYKPVVQIKFVLLLVFAAWFGACQLGAQTATNALILRGKYLVENVAMCADCHTPRDDRGQFDRSQWLRGNVLDFKPDHPTPFAAVAVPIAGLPGFTGAQAVKFLETGIDTTGKPAMPPMPQFRFKHDDAVAVVAYLRSLNN